MSDLANPDTGATEELPTSIDGWADKYASKWEPQEPTHDQAEEEAEATEEGQSEVEEEPEAAQAEEETETEEAEESESDESDEDEPEPDESEEADEEPTFTVKVAGEEKQVNLDELRKGYMLESDYRRKTDDLSKQRNELAQEREQFTQERQSKIDEMGFLVSQMVDELTAADQGTNWEELRNDDPAEFAAKSEEHRRKRELLNKAYNEYQGLSQQREQAAQEQMQKRLESERERLLERLPEWQEPEKAQSEQAAIRTYLMSEGFADDEIANAADHRLIVMARKAMLYDKQADETTRQKQTAKTKKVASLPKVRKAGAASTVGSKQHKQQEAAKRLKSQGNIDSAANWLLSRS